MKKENLFIILFIVFFSCKPKSQDSIVQQTTNSIDSSLTQKTDLLENQETTNPKIEEYKTLLQGKWQSNEDENSFIVFEGNIRKDIYKGEKIEESEDFKLSNNCLNEGDKNQATSGNDHIYMSVKKSDMCWNIVELDNESLTLNYTARGNDLSYTKVKK